MKMGQKCEIFNKIFIIGPFGLLYGPENLKTLPNTIHWLWKGYEVSWFLGWRIILLIQHISVNWHVCTCIIHVQTKTETHHLVAEASRRWNLLFIIISIPIAKQKTKEKSMIFFSLQKESKTNKSVENKITRSGIFKEWMVICFGNTCVGFCLPLC